MRKLLMVPLVLLALGCARGDHITKITNPPEPLCMDIKGVSMSIPLSQVEDLNSVCFIDGECFYGCRHHGPVDKP